MLYIGGSILICAQPKGSCLQLIYRHAASIGIDIDVLWKCLCALPSLWLLLLTCSLKIQTHKLPRMAKVSHLQLWLLL